MPTNRHPARHPHRGRLTHTQSMVLRYGPDPRWDAFHSEEEHRDAWARNRDRLLAAYRHDRRPMAWWRFEAPFPFPGYEREQSTLFDAGLLDEEEAAALVREWRREFERAWEPHFFHCSGPGRFFSSALGRRKHYRWADVPLPLALRWTRERRRKRQIQEEAVRCDLLVVDQT